MLILYLSLFLKFEIKRIISYFFILFLIIFFLESNPRGIEIPLYFYLGSIVSVLGFLLIYLQIKARKILIILDTKLKQEQFKEEKGIDPVEGRSFTSKYKYWLLKNAKKYKLPSIYKNFFHYNSQNYCLYCYFSIVPIIIVWVFSNMYMTSMEALILSFSLVGCLILLCVTLEKRNVSVLYTQLDSEIKQILFEESTGYDPLDKGKYTYKYKAWLVLSE
jgi:hypothetical protein